MARIRGAKSRMLSVREDAAAIHDDVNDHEASGLGVLQQHGTSPGDASARLNSKRTATKEPQLNESETSSRSPKGDIATRKLQEAKCKGSGECDRLGESEPSGSGSGVARHVAAASINGATGPEVDVARAVDRELSVCTLNQNPAEFVMSFESGYFWRLPG